MGFIQGYWPESGLYGTLPNSMIPIYLFGIHHGVYTSLLAGGWDELILHDQVIHDQSKGNIYTHLQFVCYVGGCVFVESAFDPRPSRTEDRMLVLVRLDKETEFKAMLNGGYAERAVVGEYGEESFRLVIYINGKGFDPSRYEPGEKAKSCVMEMI